MNLSGLGPMFEEFSMSLNAQRRNILPHESLGGRSPFSILFPTKTPPLHLFKPFGCHATILKPEAALFKKTQPRGLTGIYIGTALPRSQCGYLIWIPSQKRITTAVHAVFDENIFQARRFSPRIHDLFASLPSTHNKLFDDHLSVSHYTPSPQHTQVTPVESHSYSSDKDQPLELDTASNDEEPNDDMPVISVEEGKLDTTPSKPSSKYFDEYEFNQQHPDSIHKKSNVTEKMSKDISNKVTAAESLSSMSSTRSGQVYSESGSKAKVSYDIFTGDEISVTGFLSMGKDDVENSGTIKPALLIRTLVKAYKTLAKAEPAMRTHAAQRDRIA